MAGKPRILVIGASGYIGGSLLSELVAVSEQPYILSALVRKVEQVDKLREVGVSGIMFKNLDDIEVIRDKAAEHDIIIAAASARNANCAKACIQGLGQRQKTLGHDVHYIHTSGASMLGDWPETRERIDTFVHSDLYENIYDLEKNFPETHSPVRKVNQLVVEHGEQYRVRTYIVAPPLIFGRGTGLFTEGSGQIHMMIQLALKKNQAVMIGSGNGIWSRIHISDLNKLYYLLVSSVINGKDIPSGKDGYYFAENGSQSWKSIAEAIGIAGNKSNTFKSSFVGNIDLQEAADVFYNGNLRDAEGVLASNAKIKGDRARHVLGWQPQFGEAVFDQAIKEVFATMSNK